MILEYVACNCCESRNAEAYGSARSHYGAEIFQIVRCRDCGLIFVNPRVAGKPDEIASRSVAAPRPGAAERRRRTSRAAFVLHKLGRYRSAGTLLDFGCGRGFLVHQAATAGWDAWGVELNAALAEAGRAYWGTDRILSWDLDTLKMHFGSHFDVINASQVFEHLTDPLGTARDLAALLKDGGLLSVDVPNVRSLRYRLRRGAAFDPTAHLYHFSARTLSNLLRRAGLEVVEAKTSLTLLNALERMFADPARAAALAYRISRLPSVGFTLNVLAVKRPTAAARSAAAPEHLR